MKFPLVVAPDARVGHHKQVYCQVTIIENEEPVMHTLGTGELRIEAVALVAEPGGSIYRFEISAAGRSLLGGQAAVILAREAA